jgi:hypothetical protein
VEKIHPKKNTHVINNVSKSTGEKVCR